jgi:hypothetical protein
MRRFRHPRRQTKDEDACTQGWKFTTNRRELPKIETMSQANADDGQWKRRIALDGDGAATNANDGFIGNEG